MTTPHSWPPWRWNSCSGLDAPPTSYVTARNSVPVSVAAVRRSQTTPEASRMRFRSSARWTGPPDGVGTGARTFGELVGRRQARFEDIE